MKRTILVTFVILCLGRSASAELLSVDDNDKYKSVIETNSIDKSKYPLISVATYYSYKNNPSSKKFLSDMYGKSLSSKISTSATDIYINCEESKWMMGNMNLFDKKKKLLKTFEMGVIMDIVPNTTYAELKTFLCK